jgi:CheY-like chemotaxis protein
VLHFTTKPSMHKYTLADSSRGFVKPLVLVVEDQEINADLLRQLLHKLGICCAWARNGAEAIEMFLEASPGTFQAILMDIQMPVMDGIAATRVIRGLPRFDAATVPIIATTALKGREEKEKFYQAGMNGYMGKPYSHEKLIEVLQRHAIA